MVATVLYLDLLRLAAAPGRFHSEIPVALVAEVEGHPQYFLTQRAQERQVKEILVQ
jgi:hypothetical protein